MQIHFVATQSTTSQSEREDGPPAPNSAETTIVWVLWVTYGAFYFCRQNISAAVPGLQDDLGYTKEQIGPILAGLKIAYAVGQLVNGQLAERYSPRLLLAVGMLGSAALNVLFSFSTGLYFLLFVWATNGYCQALGWTPCMRVAANWFPVSRRGRLLGILGTSYQLTAALTFVVAGLCVDALGWRAAFYVPAMLLTAAALFMLLFLREHPEQHSARLARAVDPHRPQRGSWIENLKATLTNRSLWFLAVSLMLLDACRYGFTDWGLAHLKEVQGSSVGINALKYAVLPMGGIAGALLGGWATDRFFHGRRAPVITGFLLLLGCLTLAYDEVSRNSPHGTVVLLAFVGFCVFGPQVLLVGTAPSDLARRGTAAAAAGFVNFMGYIGAATGDTVTGYVVHHFGWRMATLIWAGWAFAAALVAACLWNAKAKTERSRREEPSDAC